MEAKELYGDLSGGHVRPIRQLGGYLRAYRHRSLYLSIRKTIYRFSLRDGMLSLSSSSSSSTLGSSPDLHYIPGLNEHGTGPDFSFTPSTAYSTLKSKHGKSIQCRRRREVEEDS
ncbi:hypothetical protein VKT23_014405 [Stygiomarasmius scandens]|uniref:Maturase K n=1 Tax=Marasmiellus scandens TaxID=2682957 RepID=A0ABR1J3X6_9AGAR